MRVQPWLTPILSLLLLVSYARNAQAQVVPGMQTSAVHSVGNLGSTEMPYAGLPPGYTGGNQGFVHAAGGAPDGAQPWPTITPYDPMFSQHYTENGLWHRITNNSKSYWATFDYIRTISKGPHGIVGAESGVQSYKDEFLPIISNAPISDQATADQFRGTNTMNLTNSIGQFAAGVPQFNYYNWQNSSQLGKNRSDGLRLRAGFFNPDDSGLSLELLWSARDPNTWSVRTRSAINTTALNYSNLDFSGNDPRDYEATLLRVLNSPTGFLTDVAPLDLEEIIETTLKNLRGLPVFDGSFAGTTIPFDLEFTIEHSAEQYGAVASWYATPIVRKKGLLVRPLVSVRYFNLGEQFRFRGRDSGLVYDNQQTLGDPLIPGLKLHPVPNGLDDNTDGIIDNAGDSEAGGGAGGGAAVDAVQFDEFKIAVAPYTAYLNAETRTHLAGPEVGLRYDLGSDHFKFWGQTKVALLANHETTRIEGDNIGAATKGDLLNPTPTNATPNKFSDKEDHNHVSPMFEQGIYMDAQLFHYVPVLNRISLFDEANFQLGYTVVVIGEVARPHESIKWLGNPSQGLFPKVSTSRESWWTQYWNFGLGWTY